MEQKFMAKLHRKEDRLKEMSAKTTRSPQQRSMVKRIKQKLRKQAHKPDFEYQPMTKAKENIRNKIEAVADVPKPTEGADEEKEKKNEKKKEEIGTEKEPTTELEPKEGAHEAKEQRKEKMKEDISQEKEGVVETKPKEDVNQGKTQVQVLESDDDFKEESIHNKPLTLSCRKTNKVIDAFAEMKLTLQPSIEEFEKHDLAFARNPYAGKYYVFSTLINFHLVVFHNS
ncbi:vicilin-like seed storage protein At2g18540 [Camellia sinensis]|uniref:vicilin-like seed storage protein At2g18540 n=1 Tax=Camellia sinensis TaxID=4442 RepID=UPI00103611A1|nr:vicilin-like seed storage protein At2g18540 [Camellia sinensis]